MKKITKYLSTLSWCILFSASSVFVQQGPEELIRKYNLSFPIVELGNCTNYQECREYCEDPLNQNACVSYAKNKGFYQAPPIEGEKEVIVNIAKGELGCDSHSSCKQFCEKRENFEKCNSFAQKHSLAGGYRVDPAAEKVLEKAKAVLGCSSYETCKNYCSQEANADICTQFARNVGIRGGEETKGPGNCTSETSCKAYCSNPANFAECSKFTSAGKVEEFRGPGGCNSEESCKAYCEKNPEHCYGYSLTPYKPSDSIEACTKISGCLWIENSCQCTGGYQDPKTVCQQTPGCSWTGASCQCLDRQTSETGTICQPPSTGCGTDKYWDSYSCSCKLSSSDSSSDSNYCKEPSTGCATNYYWDSYYCSCKPKPTGTTCQPPSTGCGTDKYWDSYYCSCRSSSTDSSTCHEPSTGCGTNYYWDTASCTCKTSSYGTPSYGTPTYGTPSYGTPTYGTPSYGTPSYSYPSPDYSYPSPDYGTPSYGTPSYGTPSSSDMETICNQTSGCSWTGTTCQCAQGIRDAEFTEELAKEHNITFPITELGNCDSCGSCNDYCSIAANKDKCNAFAQKTGLDQAEEKEKTEIYQAAKEELGCESEESCKLFCQKEENYDKCKTFAAKQDIIDDPVIVNVQTGATISETQSIELKAPKSATIDIVLQPIDSVTDTIYIGRTRFKSNLTTGEFSWDSTHTPNGQYNLIATVYDGENVISTIGPIKIEVNNLAAPGGEEITAKDIILPSQFNPEETAVDNTLSINQIEDVKTEINEKSVLLQGVATANTIITLLIYSNPIVVTVKTDANGLWKYILEKPLDSGEHTAYVVTGRTDGTKIRSEVSSFFVAPALAAANDESLNLESANEAGPIRIFVYITIAIIMLAAVAMLVIYRLKTRSSSSDNNTPSNI